MKVSTEVASTTYFDEGIFTYERIHHSTVSTYTQENCRDKSLTLILVIVIVCDRCRYERFFL